MTLTLSKLFENSKGKPVNYEGDLIHGIFIIDIKIGVQKCEFRRIRGSSKDISGMHFKCVGGSIEVNGIQTSQMTLWADTSPEAMQFNVHAKKKCFLKIWNKWRYENVQHAWLGNSGMKIRSKDSSFIFECSQGFGEVDFSAFVAEFLLID
jgi:hypothetical protein